MHVSATTSASTSSSQEMNALITLVARLSAVSLEATRLAVEVQAKLPAVIASEAAAAVAVEAAATTAKATAEAVAAANAGTASDDDDPDPVWVRRTPITPAALAARHPDGTGEVWYVVTIGREPGLYRTPDEANAQCDGVPFQQKEKRKTRREALAWYASRYNAADGEGVQKWVEV
ncbi:hypothetical protein B0H17DRAFT_1197422 [Mycena rosella]|uniref:Ribonuclease H1 N-terminal domain-containing protein n=1 Tax=Mycena rosella TaxID=1033263 RepID=A0AAD7DQI9_MYCRO|nr:hypothetical protein B0H17DRAFT_1149397 [Mycena rosella]KAJ7697367.1 hypothetical protein B0H17DRAFT_1197422 [Mycena rosella]